MSRSRFHCGLRYRHLTRGSQTTYQDHREKILFKMGFASYRDYLRSDLWKGIRAIKLAETKSCELCDAKAQQVHHLSYGFGVLKGNRPDQLACLCRQCHHEIEFKADGTKRTFEAASKLTKKRLQERGRWAQHQKPKSNLGVRPDRDA